MTTPYYFTRAAGWTKAALGLGGMLGLLAAAPLANGQTAATGGKLTTDQLAFFEKKIRPVLVQNCYKCHAIDAERIKGGLTLDTREGIRAGGDNGHAIVPGDLKASLLLKAIRYDDSELQMPPKKDGGKLPDSVIADFEEWVRMGAPDPRDGQAVAKKGIDIEKGRQHWAFQAPKKSPAPSVKDTSWARNDIDRFVQADREAKNLKPVGDADKRTLIRRVYYDLTGLPPTPEEVEAFANSKDPKAYENVVDKLLKSAQFGERWGRHWLDVARYAESSGKENNIVYPHAWRYRDYVISAFNADMPYDRFLKEQIAGDLLPAKTDTDFANHLIATGFLAIGAKSHNTRDRRQFEMDLIDEQIDAFSQGMLGLTVACARCHDHKFDPIPTKDYYALAGIFMSTETMFGTPRFIQNNQTTPLLMLPEKAEITDAPALPTQLMAQLKVSLERAKKDRDEIIEESRAKKDAQAFANPRLIGTSTQVSLLEKVLGRYDDKGKPTRLAMGVQERNTARDAQLLQRGELEKPGERVPRGFLQVINTQPAKINKGSGRLELANWIASPENPLTARVMANRVWLHLFGDGIVPTPDNFGTTGQAPKNLPLLDHLAISFVEHGWSVKSLIRDIVTSHTYQMASDFDGAAYAVDPDNVHHWRMNKRRLDAEAIRDSMLVIAGKLDLKPAQGSKVSMAEGPALALSRPGGGFRPAGGFRPGSQQVENPLSADTPVRSVYLPIVRDQVPDALEVFDFAEPSLVVGEREDTTVPSQALYLLNNAMVQRLSENMADRLIARQMTGPERARQAFMLVYSRPPTEQELESTKNFFEKFYTIEGKQIENRVQQQQLGRTALIAFCQALFGSAEFRYLN